MKLCVHDNINAFLGISYDSPDMFVAWQQCFKGTLTDVLQTAAVRKVIQWHQGDEDDLIRRQFFGDQLLLGKFFVIKNFR